jgi:hypothetical protein
MENIIRYNSRTFTEIKDDLIEYIRRTYPETISDFTDSSVGALLIELNAGVSNNLAINTDRVFQETQLEQAQKRSSIFNIAKNLGFKIPPKRASVSIVDITVTVPAKGDSPDNTYYPILMPGSVIMGGGVSFETQNTIDWESPISLLGNPNRSIIPNVDSNGIIMSYNVTKREVVTCGTTKIYKRVITNNDVKQFFTITLPETNVLEIDGIILLEGTNYTTNPTTSDFMRSDVKYYEVEHLAQQRVFIENNNISYDKISGVKPGYWVEISKKFMTEYTHNGFCKITFGSGDSDVDVFRDGFLKYGVTNRFFLNNYLNNTALGEKLKPNHTLFIRYRTGGGSNTNLGTGVLNQMGSYNLMVMGSRQQYNQMVRQSLTVTNPIPASGGNDGLSVNQIRHLIKYNFSSQNRDVSLGDYLLQVYKMPGKFGSPFKVAAYKKNNKVIISVLGIGIDGKLSNISNSLLKENISEYLSEYRMVNDYIEVKDGKIINLAIDVTVFTSDVSEARLSTNIINKIINFFNIINGNMNSDVFMGVLERDILGVEGVMNILNIKIYNKVGGEYSINTISQQLENQNTGEIKLINNTIYSTEDSMFEIKHPSKDIRVFLRKGNL